MLEALSLLTEYLNKKGLKNTRQRKLILEVFLQSPTHVSPEELLSAVQQESKGVGMATIYRTMKLFTEAGISHERRFDDGVTRYEVAYNKDHHDHLICTLCGHIFEFEDEIIEEQQRLVAQKYNLQITSHKLQIYGQCQEAENCSRYQDRR